MPDKSIVILGGGTGGIVAANKLRAKLPSDIKIILIERNPIHTFAASYLWLMVGIREPEKISTSLSKLITRGVKIINEEVKHIDTANRKVQIETRDISYDYLIVSLGADLDKKYMENYKDGIHNFYTFEGAKQLREELNKFKSGEIILAVESIPYKCPGAPFEAAMLIADFINKRRLKDKVKISLYTPEPQPLPVAGPELGKSVADLINTKGINFFPAHKFSGINPGTKTITFNTSLSLQYDLLIVIPSHIPPKVLSNSNLTDESGWIPVDKNSLAANAENVYAIGDVTSVSIPGRWDPDKPMKLPKAGVFAHSQAITVSEIIASKILGKETKESFCGDGFCMLEAGEDFAGFAYGDFFGSPHPDVKMKKLGKMWHIGKVFFEKWWLAPIGPAKEFYKLLLLTGGRLLKIPIKL